MKEKWRVAWPCGLRVEHSVAAWHRVAPSDLGLCPLHGADCPVPNDDPLRRRVRELHGRMYDLDHDAILEEIEGIVEESRIAYLPGPEAADA